MPKMTIEFDSEDIQEIQETIETISILAIGIRRIEETLNEIKEKLDE
jgi:hypothetical protein|tara:strand:+ start:2542 stop:2682 length:141 start_codon:yes stop_codon:yes gene_type:complete